MTSSHCSAFLLLVIGLLVAVCTVNVAAQETVLQLSVPGPSAGSIESLAPGFWCDAACSLTVPSGDTVTLEAHAGPGNQFDGWAGDCSGFQATCTLLMGGTRLAVTSFKPAGDPLTVIHRFLGGSLGSKPHGDVVAGNGYLYGMTSYDGRAGRGTVFRARPVGRDFIVLHDFLGAPSDGSSPQGSLIESGGQLFGMTSGGGSSEYGTIFRINWDGSGYAILHSFSGGVADGSTPLGSLVEVGGVLYGMTSTGGASSGGTIFLVNPDGSGYTLLHSFAGGTSAGMPHGSLIAIGDALFGLTYTDSVVTPEAATMPFPGSGFGTIFKLNTDGSGYTILHSFGGYYDGGFPKGSLTAVNGVLYGMTSAGGASNYGTIFRLNADGSGYTILHSFANNRDDGGGPCGSLTAVSGVLYGMTSTGGASGDGTIFRAYLNGSRFALLHSFAGGASDGSRPWGSLITSGDTLYGMTSEGGAADAGTIFTIKTDGGDYGLVHSFVPSVNEGSEPSGSLIASGAALYGTTSVGGNSGDGTIFRVNPDGSGYALLHSFTGEATDGSLPNGSLVEVGRVLYGMTSYGGVSNVGTVFRVNPDGSGYALLHSFAGGASDGSEPSGSLIASGGTLYGMTRTGGALDAGSVFKVNTDGSGYTLLRSFAGYPSDGGYPEGSLIESGGVLFGMTYSTIFRINPDGSDYMTLHSFAGTSDGLEPHGSLTAVSGVLYGTTSAGGASGGGTVFQINPDGSGFGLLHSFAYYTSDGTAPSGSLTALRGVLYGTTAAGGASGGGVLGDGTIFKINTNGSDYAVVHSFVGSDGSWPSFSECSLTTLAGVLYGATSSGGIGNSGVLFRLYIPGNRVRQHLQRQ